MNLEKTCIMVLGGWGLVGMAVCRRLLDRGPQRLVLLSLRQSEAEEAVKELQKEYPNIEIIPAWGDIFVRENLKDIPRSEIISQPDLRRQFIEDVYEKPATDRLRGFFLYKLITSYKPDVIVDSINSATGLAYQDVYKAYHDVKGRLNDDKAELAPDDPFFNRFNDFLTTVSLPQLIRHIQVLLYSASEAGVHTYVKIGTTGTGGMGLNIPYTHSEERPSGQLLSKSALAGAHSMLLFLIGRTPGCPYIKEVKPATAIAWKAIGYGEIRRAGKPIQLFDCPPDKAETLTGVFKRVQTDFGEPLGENLKSVYINTGENGIFSAAEFQTITAAAQMEFVTPEEIAQAVLWEIEGGNSGFDIVGALDATIMGPTYRAGILRGQAIEYMKRLEKKNKTASIAFEMLGPPRLSKLLYEAHLLKIVSEDPESVPKCDPADLSQRIWKLIKEDSSLRARIISIGVPILTPDGKELIRGPEVKIPPYTGSNEIPIEKDSLDNWANEGWVDLRPVNIKKWQKRILNYLAIAGEAASVDTSSRFHWERSYHGREDEEFVGNIVAHIFIDEEKGGRMK